MRGRVPFVIFVAFLLLMGLVHGASGTGGDLLRPSKIASGEGSAILPDPVGDPPLVVRASGPGGQATAATNGSNDDPELGPLISGTSSYVDGTYVWTDYAYDDRGPNTNGMAGGNATYPGEPYPGNTADIIQLQLGTSEDGSLRIVFVLNTLVEDGDADLGVGFDTDLDPWTGSPEVPGGQWRGPVLGLDRPAPLRTEKPVPLGLEVMAVLSTATSTGTVLTFDEDAGDWVSSGTFPVDVDRDRNAVSADVAALKPGTTTWRAVGVAGMADEQGSWVNGAHPIYDLAFVRAEDPHQETAVALTYQVPQARSHWQDDIQADILAGYLPPVRPEHVAENQALADTRDHHGTATITFGTGRTELAQPRSPGLETFLYHSRVDLGEGIRQTPSLRYQGRYQPYVVYIPPGLDADGVLPHRPPAVVFLHGANQNHLTNAVHFARDGLVIPGSYYEVEAVVIFPHGRDTGWGTGPAEKDALDATDDAVARLGLDLDRIVVSGVSAGGSGSYRLGTRYPDRWAGIYPQVGGGTNVPENLTNMLVRTHYSGPAEQGAWNTVSTNLTADGLVDFRAAWVSTKVHMPVQMGNCWFHELLNRPRDLDPARVRFTVPAPVRVDDDIVLAPDSAYWTSGLEVREGETGRIDATSLARADRGSTGTSFERQGENVTQSADFCGPHRNMRAGDHWIERGRALEPGELQETSNGLSVTLGGLSAATLDVIRAGLTTDETVVAQVSGDGVAELTFTGPWSGTVTILKDGEPFDTVAADGSVTIVDDFAGSHTYVVSPAA